MHIKLDVHSHLSAVKAAHHVGMSAQQADPFAILDAFVQGTGDLFDIDLVEKVFVICTFRDIRAYIELAKVIDGYTKNYVSTDPELVKGHRVLCSLLKKYPFSDTESPYDSTANATQKWRDAESQCGETNVRLRQDKADGKLPKFFHYAKRLIADALGELTPELVMKMLEQGEHGKGSSTETPFRASTVYHKYQSTELFCTAKAVNYAKAAISLNRRWYDYLDGSGIRTKVPFPGSSPAYVESQLLDEVIVIGEHERISFVNKNAVYKRPVGIGNTLNMYMQLGVKKTLTDLLLRVGVNLRDQSKNQQLAQLGSILGMDDDFQIDWQQNSTVDLVSASDMVASVLCEFFLSPEWFGLLSDLRHESGILDGEVIVYNKMSAMGNGYTFPLESLIFWAIARATAEEMDYDLDNADLAVYGDDLIVPYLMTEKLVENLSYCGFTVNTEKSFMSGPFKESCGADYYKGINVRPFYLKRRLTSTKDLYHVANAIMPRSLDDSCRVSLGYKSVYCYLQKTIESVGPINFRPLSDIVALCKSTGKTIYHDSEVGLSVPFSHYCDFGLGYLSRREKINLYNNRWFPKVAKRFRNKDLSAILTGTLPLALRSVEKPEREKDVREPLRLLTRLQSKDAQVGQPDEYDSFIEKYNIMADGTTRIVQKGNTSTTFILQPVLNWDGFASKGLLLAHPALV